MTIGEFINFSEEAFLLCIKEVFDDNKSKKSIQNKETRTIYIGYSCDLNEEYYDIPLLSFTPTVDRSMLAAIPIIIIYVSEL